MLCILGNGVLSRHCETIQHNASLFHENDTWNDTWNESKCIAKVFPEGQQGTAMPLTVGDMPSLCQTRQLAVSVHELTSWSI